MQLCKVPKALDAEVMVAVGFGEHITYLPNVGGDVVAVFVD